MARHESVAAGIKFSVQCPKCGKQMNEPLSWFDKKDIVPCGNCGHGINLKDPVTRLRLEELKRTVARFQAALTDAGKLS